MKKVIVDISDMFFNFVFQSGRDYDFVNGTN